MNVSGIIGNNTLKFLEIGNDSDYIGMHIDEVQLYLVGPANSTNAS